MCTCNDVCGILFVELDWDVHIASSSMCVCVFVFIVNCIFTIDLSCFLIVWLSIPEHPFFCKIFLWKTCQAQTDMTLTRWSSVCVCNKKLILLLWQFIICVWLHACFCFFLRVCRKQLSMPSSSFSQSRPFWRLSLTVWWCIRMRTWETGGTCWISSLLSSGKSACFSTLSF